VFIDVFLKVAMLK